MRWNLRTFEKDQRTKMRLSGMWEVVKDALCQKLQAIHLPLRPHLPDLTGLSCIVTGCTSGIGLQTARELAYAGAHVVMACRNTKLASELAQEWQRSKTLSIEVMELDLLCMASVRSFAASYLACGAPLHVLVNNAGIFLMGEAQKFSRDGFEQHMQVNHLGPALLAILLLPCLLKGSPSRILNVNSNVHHCVAADSTFLARECTTPKNFSSFTAYANSKLLHLMFLGILARKIPESAAIQVIAVHPGVVSTNIVTKAIPSSRNRSFWKFNPSEGARSVLYCATSSELSGKGRKGVHYYTYNCKAASVSNEVADTKKAMQVWNSTLDLLDLPCDFVDNLFAV